MTLESGSFALWFLYLNIYLHNTAGWFNKPIIWAVWVGVQLGASEAAFLERRTFPDDLKLGGPLLRVGSGRKARSVITCKPMIDRLSKKQPWTAAKFYIILIEDQKTWWTKRLPVKNNSGVVKYPSSALEKDYQIRLCLIKCDSTFELQW